MTVDFLIDWFSTIGDFPVIAFIFSRKTKAYLYLLNSTKKFPPRKKFLEKLKKTGFKKIETRKKLYGASTIYIASK